MKRCSTFLKENSYWCLLGKTIWVTKLTWYCGERNKLASLAAMLVRNSLTVSPTNRLTGVKCRATSVAKQIKGWYMREPLHYAWHSLVLDASQASLHRAHVTRRKTSQLHIHRNRPRKKSFTIYPTGTSLPGINVTPTLILISAMSKGPANLWRPSGTFGWLFGGMVNSVYILIRSSGTLTLRDICLTNR